MTKLIDPYKYNTDDVSEWLSTKKFLSKNKGYGKFKYEVKVIAQYYVPDQASVERLKACNAKKHKTIHVKRYERCISVKVTSKHYCKTLDDVKKLASLYRVVIRRNFMNNEWQGEFVNRGRKG